MTQANQIDSHSLSAVSMMVSDQVFVRFARNLNQLGFRRLLTDFDETVFGIQKNQDFDQLRQYFTHTQVFHVKD